MAKKLLAELGIESVRTGFTDLTEAKQHVPLQEDPPREDLISEADMHVYAQAHGYPGHMAHLAWNRVLLINDRLKGDHVESPLQFMASPQDNAYRRFPSYLTVSSLAVLVTSIEEAVQSTGDTRNVQHMAIRNGLGPKAPVGVDVVGFLGAVVRDKLPAAAPES